ncbi:MAG: metallophosphoesterase [Eubacterium sp.]|nr:metallophosphoesterase [Eubacterium sp.]
MLKICIIIIAILIILIILAFVESFRELRCVKITTYDIEDDKISEDKTVVFLSDYHEARIINEKIVSAVDKVSPDAILVGGDMINGFEHEGLVESSGALLNKLVEKYPVYYAYGNHESKLIDVAPDVWKKYQESLSSDINYLLNDSVSLGGNIRVYGLNTPREFYKRGFGFPKLTKKEIEELLGEKSINEFGILLGHAPDFIEGYTSWEADLSLSGHFHGGMVRLPLLGGMVSPRLLLLPRYDYGIYEENSKKEIVTNGLGQHSIKIRINNIPEIVRVNLKKPKGV